MDERIMWWRGVLLGFLFLLTGGLWLDLWWQSGTAESYLEVHFLNVGQGDATFIETPDGVQVLVDGGPEASVLRELSSQMSFFDREIDVVVATHPDSDHIGGLIDVLKRYKVGTVVLTENDKDTPAANAFRAALETEGAELVYARAGASLSLGASTTLNILFPDRNPAGFEANAASIIAQLQYGDVEFMLTGDAPKSIEEYLIRQYGESLESEVLKVGHHGSDTSTAGSFLEIVDPDFGVVSAGADNRYGHPHVEVVERLREAQVQVHETKDGMVSFQSDSHQVWLSN